jgi:hypothetical protein
MRVNWIQFFAGLFVSRIILEFICGYMGWYIPVFLRIFAGLTYALMIYPVCKVEEK